MRIRSIKYNSSNITSSHQTLTKTKETFIVTKKPSSPVNITRKLTSSSFRNLTKNKPRYVLTEQCSNNRDQGNEDGFVEMRVMKVNRTKESSSFGLNSKISNFKGKSLHDSGKKIILQKENVPSYLQIRRKPSQRELETSSVYQKREINREKIKLKLQKFTQAKNKQLNLYPHNESNQSTPIQADEREQIILGDNLTYNADIFQKQLLSLHEETLKQKIQIDKIREQLFLFRSRIQSQLDSVVVEFQKGMDKLKGLLRKQKADKCAIIINWKTVIDEKYNQYQEEGQIMQFLEEQVGKVENCIERNEVSGQ